MNVRGPDTISILTDEEKKLLSQGIKVGIKNRPDTIITLPRSRLKKQTVDDLFEVNAEFLRDDTGEIIHHEDWLIECQTIGKYHIVEAEVKPPKVDPAVDPYYIGNTLLVAVKVPQIVNATDLIAWLQHGIGQEDSVVQHHEKELNRVNMEIMAAERRLQAIPYMETEAKDFKKQAAERRLVSELVNEERATLIQQRIEHINALGRMKKREDAVVKVLKLDHDHKNKHCTWTIVIEGNEGEAYMQKLAVKEDWGEIVLGIGLYDRDPCIPPVTAVKELPKEQELEEDYSIPIKAERYVNMRNVEIVRYKHGDGAYLYADGDVFQGTWKYNHPHGSGELFTKQGYYQGQVDEGNVNGQGRMIFSDGRSYVGKWGAPTQCQPSLINGLEYSDGLPHGEGKMTFIDGSVAKGTWYRGRPEGKHTTYTTSKGSSKDGPMVRGILHGSDCTYKDRAGLLIKGRFRDDKWEGRGYYQVEGKYGGYSMEGNGNLGMAQGVAKTKWDNGDSYYGFYKDGFRHGTHGEFMYGDVSNIVRHGVKTFKYNQKFSGRWTLGTPANRGVTIVPLTMNTANKEKKRIEEEERLKRGGGKKKEEEEEEAGGKKTKEKKEKKEELEREDRILKVTGLYTTNGRSSHFPRLYKVQKGEYRELRRLRKKIQRDHSEVQNKREEMSERNYRNYRRRMYRSGLVLENSGSLMANERQSLIEEEKWRQKELRRLEKARAGKKQRFNLSAVESQKLKDKDMVAFDDGFELTQMLADLATEFNMAKIMKNPPSMDELDEKLDEIKWMEDEYAELRWERKDAIQRKLKGLE
jgi:hypothetical protein|tara:strand:+ start:106 stop:2526 length:2421 start_codon:yes stop_codon:yes gene_type:complete